MVKKIEEIKQAFSNRNKKQKIADMLTDNEFISIYEKCKECSMTSLERMYALYKSVEYAVNSKISGDFVECGVWRGGSAMLVAHTLVNMNETDKKIWLYDTFEGMSKPSTHDTDIFGRSSITRWKRDKKEDYCDWCFSPISEVKKNMQSTGYPHDNLVFVKGKIEDTVPNSVPSQIALLRLDTDWYESTKHELEYLYPLIARNGVLIIDDYGHWTGCKKAVDEYISQHNLPIFLNRIDYTGRLAIKTS